jgi:NADH-quinone oxidoreductase subunit L
MSLLDASAMAVSGVLALAGLEGARGVTPGPSWAVLIPGLPVVGALLCVLCAVFGVKSKLPAWITVGCLAGSFVAAFALWQGFGSGGFGAGGGAQTVQAWRWFDLSWTDRWGKAQGFVAPFGFYIDTLTIFWMLFVTGLATLIALYASEYMSHDVGTGYCRFFFAFNLFVFSMACLVMGGNLVMLYLGWEGVGLCSYLLIGYFYKKPSAVAAAKKAFIVNRVGDLGLALGLYLTFVHFGTVEYAALFNHPQLAEYIALAKAGDFSGIPGDVQWIALLLMVGAFGKSAQFPLYVWLPDAMEGPTPVSALIHAATMVTAGVYLVARFFPVFLVSEWALPVVAWVGTGTALLAATIGMAQFDIKRIMAYSTVSQLGYMFAGLGVLTPVGGAYHVLTHAFFKALLFLCCGAVMHGFAGQLDLRKLSGVAKLKGWGIVSLGMLVGCINLAGVPFTAGYFSKDTILAEAFVTPGYAAIGWILLATALMTAYYTFRVFFRVFLGPVHFEPGDEHHADDHHGHDHAHSDHAHGHDHGHGHAHGHGHDHGHSGEFHPHAPGWAINTVLAVLTVASLAASGLYFVGGREVVTPSGEHVKAKHYAAAMVQQSTAAYVTPYDHHAFDHAGHKADEAPGGALAPQAHSEAHSSGHASAVAGAGIGPRGVIAEPLSIFGHDPHKAMYYVSGVVGAIGILLAAALHWVGRKDAAHCRMDSIARLFGPIPRWAERKWMVDELYDTIFRKPLLWVGGHAMHWFDKLVVDGIVNVFGGLPRALASMIRPSQSGFLHGYAAGMVAGLAVILFLIVALVMRAGGAA